MTCISRSYSGSWNSITLPVSISIRWKWWPCSRRLVAGATAAEIASLEDALLLQQAHRAVDSGDRDAGVQRAGTAVEFLDIGVIGGLGQDTGNDATLPRHLEASFDAQALDARFHRIPL